MNMNAPGATHYNYVVFFADANRAKVGITAQPAKRLAYYKQEAKRHGLGRVEVRLGQSQPKHFARIVETEMCRALKPAAIERHREWFETDREGFDALHQMTARFQRDLRSDFAGVARA